MADKGSIRVDRVTYSPGEFAALFGKSQTWGYRQIYAGRVTAITEYGRILIPASEVDKVVGSAGRYGGIKKNARTKDEIQALKPMLQNAWKEFIRGRRGGSATDDAMGDSASVRQGGGSKSRRAVLERLAGRRDSAPKQSV